MSEPIPPIGQPDPPEYWDEMLDAMDGYCIECGDEFHLDDCGGYNPPCQGCGLCHHCCECDRYEDDWEEEEEA